MSKINPPKGILHLDDDQLTLKTFFLAFEKMDKEIFVKSTDSVDEFLALVGSFKPDLIILDLKMPDMDGPDVISSLSGNINKTPIIFLTGKTQVVMQDAYKKIGVIGVIPKPFDPMTVVDDVLALWAKHRESLED